MGKQLFQKIVTEWKLAKYFSISVDSTPDLTKIDQLSFTTRYVLHDGSVERFLIFIPIKHHTGEYLADCVLDFLKEHGIDVMNCVGQSYDNASNMSGQYKGLQARIKNINPMAEYIPCTGHSLNLIGVKAAESSLSAVNFFGFVQKLYVFFAASTHRWSLLTIKLGNLKVVKRMSDTRWSARADAVDALYNGFRQIQSALEEIATDPEEEKDAVNEADSLLKKMDKLDCFLMSVIWAKILNRFNAVSKTVQDPKTNLSSVVLIIESLKGFIQSLRNEFDTFEGEAKFEFPEAEYAATSQRNRQRSVRMKRFEGNAPDAVITDPSTKFRVETFYPIIDSLVSGLETRGGAYKRVDSRFSFLANLNGLSSSAIRIKCNELSQFYVGQFNANELHSECIHLKDFAASDLMENQADENNGKLAYRFIVD